MFKQIWMVGAMSLMVIIANAQQSALRAVPLKKVMELKMPRTTADENPGTRGGSVVWHPIQKRYFANFCGNATYPLAFFDVTGKLLSEDNLSCQVDLRGIWFNPIKKLIQGNGYGEIGWVSYQFDKNGIPNQVNTIREGMFQPGEHAVGFYHPLKNKVIFLSGKEVYYYSPVDQSVSDTLLLHWGRTKAEGPAEEDYIYETPEAYNYTSLVFTGIKAAEIGVLNADARAIELYDEKTGFLTRRLTIPEAVPVESAFNFSFANGIFWLFSIEARTWIGLK